MTPSSLKRATYSAFITSLTFWLLFQLSKIRAIQSGAPFADDPYDAIASFAFQIAVAIALLSLARLVSIRDEQGLHQRATFILHGILLVVACVTVTLVADFIAVAQAWPLTFSSPIVFLLAGLTLLSALAGVTGILLAIAWKDSRGNSSVPTGDALAQAIGDCWILVTIIATWLTLHLPFLKQIWKWIDSLAHRIAAAWNKWLPFANPSTHPWKFALSFSILVGFAVMGIIMLSEGLWEGGPANPAIALLLALIFFVGETVAVILSFLFFGGYLGLRPKLG
jgi:hypothetical protein